MTDSRITFNYSTSRTIANIVAENSNPKYIEDVRSRKLTIASGSGVVHGVNYDISNWGIDEFNWA